MAGLFGRGEQRVSGSCILELTLAFGLSFMLRTVAKPACDINSYYDNVTRICAHCSDICEHSETQVCDEKCPGYKNRHDAELTKCLSGYYYDEKTERCDHCATTCLYGTSDTPIEKCRKLCDDLSRGSNDESTNVLQNGSFLPHNHTMDIQKKRVLDATSSSAVILVIVVLGIVVLITVMMAYTISKTNISKKMLHRICSKRSIQAEQRESHELSSLTGEGNPLSQPQQENEMSI